ncbi:MAG TPA: hypothetical protein VHL11_16105 [Phototrophicaceae bacterium]|jgi:tRNA nucleotidyltransferase/poly(A) polymerase|nr:hypothetical protein [Phototrophicaceae bacterium]
MIPPQPEFDLTPHQPQRPLFWSDAILDLQELISTFDSSIQIYIVGGAVRDAWLHRPIKDLDLAVGNRAVAHSAIKLARQIANRLEGDVYVLDDERDIARVIYHLSNGDDLNLDIAAFRGEDLLADLRDRDFTLNAMAIDLRRDPGLLIDPLGGEQDLKDKRIRRCSPDAIATDVIRGLRAVRQSVQLGFRLDAATLADIRSQAGHLRETSNERIRDELFKILSLTRPSAALRVADRLGLVGVIIPDFARLQSIATATSKVPTNQWEHTLLVMDKLTTLISAISFGRTDNTASTFELGMVVIQFDRYRKRLNDHLNAVWTNDRPHRALMMLAALLHDTGDVDQDNQPEASAVIAEHYADDLRLSNAEKQRMLLMIKHHHHQVFSQPITPLIAHRYWYRLGEAGVDVILLKLADTLGTQAHTLVHSDWLVLVERAVMLLDGYYLHHDEIVVPVPLVDGNQLKKDLQLQPGPVIGELLTLIREGQVEGRIQTVDEALAAARDYLSR